MRGMMRLALLGVPGARGGAWSPADIDGLVLWLDASDSATLFQDAAGTTPAIAAADPVGAWLDKSGHGYHATQSQDSFRPTLATTGLTLPSVVGDGTKTYLTTPTINHNINTGDFYFVTVVRKRTNRNFSTIYSVGSGSPGLDLYQQYVWLNSWESYPPTLTATENTNYIIEVYRDGTEVTKMINNNASETKTITNSVPNAIHYIFAKPGPQHFGGDQIGEHLFYPRMLSTAEREQMLTYLSKKWSIIVNP